MRKSRSRRFDGRSSRDLPAEVALIKFFGINFEKIFLCGLVPQLQAGSKSQLHWLERARLMFLHAKLPSTTSEVYSALLASRTAEHVRQLPGKK